MQKQQIVIFGTGEIAELADFYFSHDSRYEVAGFAVDAAFLKQPEFRGRPVVAFEEVAEKFPKIEFRLTANQNVVLANASHDEKVAITALLAARTSLDFIGSIFHERAKRRRRS